MSDSRYVSYEVKTALNDLLNTVDFPRNKDLEDLRKTAMKIALNVLIKTCKDVGDDITLVLDERDKNGNTLLLNAMQDNDLDLFKLLLDAKANPDTENNDQFLQVCSTPLTSAINDWSLRQFVPLLLEAKANPNLRDRCTGRTPLLWAMFQFPYDEKYKNMRMDLIKLLLKHGANPDLARMCKFGQTVTPLTECVRNDYVELAELLLESKADPDLSEREYGNTPLMCAIKYKGKDLKMIKLLLKYKAKPNLLFDDDDDANSWTVAIEKGDTDVLKLLLETGNIPGYAAFNSAIKKGDASIMKLLLQDKNNSDLTKKTYKIALITAVENNSKDNVKLLLSEYKVNPNNEMLTIATHKGFTDIVELLLQFQVDPFSALEIAFCSKNINIQKLFLNKIKTTQPDLLKGKIESLLFSSLCSTSTTSPATETVKLLLEQECKFDPNAADKIGYTLLYRAADSGNIDIVERLLKLGAKPNLQCTSKETPIFAALKRWHKGIVKLLLRYEANPNVGHDEITGYSSLGVAVGKGYLDIVKLLLEHKANPNLKYYLTGKTPLIAAIDLDLTEIVELLLNHKADPNLGYATSSSMSKKPFTLAFEKRKTSIMKLLLQHQADPRPNLEKSLQYAIVNDCADLVELLLQHTSGPDLPSKLLHSAIGKGNKTIVKSLLQHQADPNMKKPLNYAINCGYYDIAYELISAGAEVQDMTLDDLKLIENGKTFLIHLLLKSNTPVNDLKKLFDFLVTYDQRDPNVFASLDYLYKKHSKELILSDHGTAELYMQKLRALHTGDNQFRFSFLKKAIKEFLPTDVLSLVAEYDGRRLDTRSTIEFFKPSTVDLVLSELKSEMKRHGQDTKEIKDALALGKKSCTIL